MQAYEILSDEDKRKKYDVFGDIDEQVPFTFPAPDPLPQALLLLLPKPLPEDYWLEGFICAINKARSGDRRARKARRSENLVPSCNISQGLFGSYLCP